MNCPGLCPTVFAPDRSVMVINVSGDFETDLVYAQRTVFLYCNYMFLILLKM